MKALLLVAAFAGTALGLGQMAAKKTPEQPSSSTRATSTT
jgi:hypothetical protein